jgi:Leucine-rich repeat (LRR) protein
VVLICCCVPSLVFPQADSAYKRLYLQGMQAVIAILNANKITNADPDEIVKIDSGRIVGLYLKNTNYDEPLIRTLPADIGKLTSLKELTLSGNFLNQLPPEIGLLTELRVLKLGDNRLATLPESMKNLIKLEVFDLRYNNFTALPAVCMSMKNLRKLQLWGNKLSTLPENFCELDSLRELYLQRNRLQTLPSCIMRMGNLVYVDFGFNNLCSVSPEIRTWLKKWNDQYPAAQFCR